jgi:hypothetical protein
MLRMTSTPSNDPVAEARTLAETAAAARRVASGCTTIMALPFVIIGVSLIASAAKHLGTEPHAWVMLLVGTAFALFAVLMVAVVNYSTREAARVADRRVAAPAEPWRWREDWERGQIRDQSTPAIAILWTTTLFWNLVSIPLAVVIWRQATLAHNAAAFLGLIFPIIGAALLIWVGYLTRRRQKYGASTCTLDRTPVALGSTLSGAIVSRLVQHPEHGISLRLSAVRRRIQGSGRSRSITEQIVWKAEHLVDAISIAFSPAGSTIPFRFDLPLEAPPADERDQNDRLIWRLDVSAEVPGVDYAARFELPVFADERHAAAREQAVRHATEVAAARPIDAEGVTVQSLPSGGEEYRFMAHRSVGGSLALTVIAIGWFGADVMLALRAPFAVTAIFFGLGLLLVLAALDSWAGSTSVRVERAAVTIRYRLLGRGTATIVDGSRITGVTAVTDTAGKPASQRWQIELRCSDGRTYTAGRNMSDQQQAEAIAARMRRTLQLA